jgi:hypothetical protein
MGNRRRQRRTAPMIHPTCATRCALFYRCMCTSWWFTGGCDAASAGGEIRSEGGREALPCSDGG